MSLDEKQNSDNDEFDLAELFRSLWFYKFSLLIFIVLSVPISIWYSSTLQPTYRAETVFERPSDTDKQGNVSLMSNIGSSRLMGFLGGGSIGGSADSFNSEIRSESFLETVILNNADVDSQMLKKFCPLPSKETSRFSLRSLLILLGISENRAPSDSQKKSLLVRCVNGMLKINFDTYGSDDSSAYRLSIESGDPVFSANLANQIVEKYFVRHAESQDEDFKALKKYLSKVIAEAQLEFVEANKLIQQFIFKHTLLVNEKLSSDLTPNTSILGGDLSLPVSPFASELTKEIANLSQLEKSLSQLKQARLSLSSLKELDQEMLKAFISSTEMQEMISRRFITETRKIIKSSSTTDLVNQGIKKIVSRELMSLKQQILALEEKIGKREEQTRQLMNIEDRFQELAIDVAKKKLIFEGLKDQLKEKIFTAGLANIRQPVLLTKAVPPFIKASPNKKRILGWGVVLSMFAGIAYILIRQLSLRRVHSLSQLKRTTRFLDCYRINYKQLKLMVESSDQSAIGQSFFSNTMGIGKLGCIIDLSQKGRNNSLASEFSKTIASLLATDNSKIVCLDSSPNKKPFSAVEQKNLVSDSSELNFQGFSNRNISSFNDEDYMISTGEINKIKNKYSDYDKIICTLDAEIGDLTKFKFMEQCNFYILIGRSFHFDEYTIKKFSNNLWEKEKKCLGFFLID